MSESRILAFLNQKLQVLVAWYNASSFARTTNKIFDTFSHTWANSLFVRSFTSSNNAEKKSLIYKLFYLPFAFLSLFANDWVKNTFTKFKNTTLYKALYCLVNNLIAVNTRFVGVLLSCGLIVYMIALRDFSNTILIAALAASIVMCIFDFSLLRALSSSIIKHILKLFLSIEPTFDYYDENELARKGRLIVAAICGIILGFIAASVSPIIALGLLGVLVVLYNVNLGVAITVFAIPFLPTMLCAALAILCFFALFLQKSVHGEKEWKLDIVGFALILFVIIVAICSVTSVARENSITICFLYIALISFYFTVTNTIKTKQELYSLLTVFIISALLVAGYGIIQYIFGLDADKQAWIDEQMFNDIKMRAFSTLENPNVLGEYLLLTIPVAVAFMWNTKKAWTKIFYMGVCGVLLLCLVLTMSRGCWIGILIAAALFITFVDARYWLLAIPVLLLAPSILPASILNRFLSIGNLGDTSSSYRLYIWLGTISMLKDFWLVGVGPGSQAYNLIYPRYSYPMIIAPHAHNVYLQQMVETGVVGIGALVFVFIAFFRRMSQKAHTLCKKSADKVMIVALCAGVLGFLVQGVFDYVFYNYRVFMMFWMYFAFGSSLCSVINTSQEAKK